MMHTIDFRDIITEEFQHEIQDSFAFATGFGVVFTDTQGRHIGSGGNFCKFCNKINETKSGAHYCALSNRKAIEIALKSKKPSIYICHAGLVNIEIPLIYEDVCVGAITAGQIICIEDHPYPKDQIAVEIDWLANPELASYYKEIEVMSCRQIEATTKSLSNITHYIIQKVAYAKAQEGLARKAEQLLKAKNQQILLEQQLKVAKLDALQKQVTPHFMFNVISSISRLLSLKEYKTAEKMLDSFAQMMRYNLSDTHVLVTLEQELRYIQNYLTIQEIRFGDRIKYHILCEAELKLLRVPFFSLQPLVENALEHGMLHKESGGTLTLSCTKDINGYIIEVSDNGIGIPKDRLETLRKTSLSNHRELDHQHIGLHNSYMRFYFLYHENVTFSIESEEDLGTTIQIKLTSSSTL